MYVTPSKMKIDVFECQGGGTEDTAKHVHVLRSARRLYPIGYGAFIYWLKTKLQTV